jgi:hypothetical protein
MEGFDARFYFHLKSKQSRIPDDNGKEFDTLNEAYEHGTKARRQYWASEA